MTATRVIAVDCDLRRVHAWDSEMGKVCYREPGISALLHHVDGEGAQVIYEIASATDYTDSSGAAQRYNKRRWMLWNMATAMQLHEALAIRGIELLVSSSQTWTNGYSEDERREITCPKPTNHDLRECQAMIWFFQKKPSQWIPLPHFLNRL